MAHVTVDLDDTLMLNHFLYERARNWFGEYMQTHFGIPEDDACDRQCEISREMVDNHGLDMERFPQACVRALHDLTDEADDIDEYRVQAIGYSVFKTPAQYANQGFRDGAEAFLESLPNHTAQHVLTAGDPRVQQRKIDGLGLDDYFDEFHIVGVNQKARVLSDLADSGREVIHVGNSLASDVDAAAEADVHAVYVPGEEWRRDGREVEYAGRGEFRAVDSMNEAAAAVQSILQTARA